jgi:transcriptional regulator with XRE-family HTH domain
MSQEDLQINGDLLRLRREARGWVLSDMATRACMSVKQIRQLEEGGISSFYSEAVKLTSARKVGALLGLSAEEVVVQETLTSSGIEEITTEIVDVPVVEVEAIDVLLAEQPTDDVASEASVEAEVSHPAVPAKDAKSKIWVTAALFAVALAVAAYMQPKEDEVAEPAPPLQAVQRALPVPVPVKQRLQPLSLRLQRRLQPVRLVRQCLHPVQWRLLFVLQALLLLPPRLHQPQAKHPKRICV